MFTIGLMSGTSMDAIDAALVRFEDESFSIVAYEQYPIEDHIRKAVRELDARSDIDIISRLDAQLGECFAEAVIKILEQSGLPAADIAAVGSHGQTVLHLPDVRHPRTLQIGDANIIAFRTGITTIADFRRMDMAAGGQGAPLAPAFHNRYLRSDKTDRIILNIGGIANVTILPADKNAPVIGFDTGPGNGLLDDWNCRHNKTRMDKNGDWAASGNIDEPLLKGLLQDPYFHLPPPKSTGRDYFNLEWLEQRISRCYRNPAPQDVQATLLELSARTITEAVGRHAPTTEEMYVCGGGVHNPRLLKRLQQQLPATEVAATSNIGIDPDAVEAVTFAWLARRRLEGVPGNLPSVTGARKPVLLGAIYSSSHKSQVTSYKK